MTWTNISLTITTYMSTDHPVFDCFLFASVDGKHESRSLQIDKANKLMWELKKKGWETTTTTHYNPFTPKVYTRKVSWLHID